jgi:hypothetical protein
MVHFSFNFKLQLFQVHHLHNTPLGFIHNRKKKIKIKIKFKKLKVFIVGCNHNQQTKKDLNNEEKK